MKIVSTILMFIFLVSSTVPGMSQSSYKIIVHNDVKQESVTKNELSKIFLKKVVQWEGGTAIKPVDQKKDSGLRLKFSKEVLKKDVNAVTAFWQRKIYSGRGLPPAEVATDAAVVEYVKNNPGAIGYVSTKAKTAGVKVLKIQ